MEKVNATTPPVGDYAVRVWQIENRLDGAEYYRGKQLANSITLGIQNLLLPKLFVYAFTVFTFDIFESENYSTNDSLAFHSFSLRILLLEKV